MHMEGSRPQIFEDINITTSELREIIKINYTYILLGTSIPNKARPFFKVILVIYVK